MTKPEDAARLKMVDQAYQDARRETPTLPLRQAYGPLRFSHMDTMLGESKTDQAISPLQLANNGVITRREALELIPIESEAFPQRWMP